MAIFQPVVCLGEKESLLLFNSQDESALFVIQEFIRRNTGLLEDCP
jgi:hypothetical protein